MFSNITMVSQILHSKNIMKIIKRLSDVDHIWPFQYCWKLVDNRAVPTIKFSIAKHVQGSTFINNCNLCISEKAFIIRNLDDVNMLNNRSEFISKCWHKNKWLLNRVKNDSNYWLWCAFVFAVCFFVLLMKSLFLKVKILTEDCQA